MMNTPPPAAPEGRLTALVAWVALCFAAAAGGMFFSPDNWYAGLVKPVWQPPAWLFGPVWTVLYILMAVAAWLVWGEGGWRKQGRALGWFLGQWLCNALWTPLFFGLHRPGLALMDMVLLWLALVVTVVLFWRARRTAGILLLPYLAWVSFAAVLNFALWRLNP
jgi:benzodiazapine receptor